MSNKLSYICINRLTQVDRRRCGEAEGLSDLHQVEGVHIEDSLQLVGVVRSDVALEGFFG